MDDLSSNMTVVVSNISKNVDELCGARFCPSDVEKAGNLHRPDVFKIQLLSGIFIALMLCATILVSLFADTLKRFRFCDDFPSFNIEWLWPLLQVRNGKKRVRFWSIRTEVVSCDVQATHAKEANSSVTNHHVHWCWTGLHGRWIYSCKWTAPKSLFTEKNSTRNAGNYEHM